MALEIAVPDPEEGSARRGKPERAQEPETEVAADDADGRLHHVVRREQLTMKPMAVDEATMQLELVDDKFLVFMNADTQQVNVMYDREDGTYGLIEPQF